MPAPCLAGRELIPGYRLTHRISAGGSGEVWAAEAPGQLSKAIKIVRNRRDWKRADEEVAALERIKHVRHPFLLSLERIEWIGEQLLVVTELADENLRSCYDRWRRQGRSGVPRPQLITGLRDAAEALDHLADEHGLQHLDVKPENLLLLAGRVKLADFELVRPIQRGASTPPGGLTPLYAAPEVFAGDPHRNSDQYSLAIVFQQMLTGRTPFRAGALEDLARWHWRTEPQLAGLVSADRQILARALHKVPERRFACCRELVEALARVDVAEELDCVLDDLAELCGDDTSLQAATEPLPTELLALRSEVG